MHLGIYFNGIIRKHIKMFPYQNETVLTLIQNKVKARNKFTDCKETTKLYKTSSELIISFSDLFNGFDIKPILDSFYLINLENQDSI